MSQGVLSKVYIYIIQYIENFTNSKYWAIKSTLLLCFVILLTSFPEYNWYFQNRNSYPIFEAIDWQIQHPLQPLPAKYVYIEGTVDNEAEGIASHLGKRWSRITVPLLGYFFGFDSFGCIVLQHITSILFLYIIILMAYKMTEDRVISFLLGCVFAFTFTGKWGFYNFYHHDGIAYFFMLMAMWQKNPFIIFFGVLLAAFTDERALIASALIYLWWHLKETDFDKLNFRSFFKFYPQTISIWCAWVCYLSGRYFIFLSFSHLIPQPADVGLNTLRDNFKYFPLGFFIFLEFAWFFVILAYLILFFQKKYTFLMFLFFAPILSYVAAFMVHDVSRSIDYAFPLLLISIYIIQKLEPKYLKEYLFVVASACFLFPTHQVFVLNIYWLSPIFPKIIKFF